MQSASAKEVEIAWQEQVKEANLDFEKGRYSQARKLYQLALKQLEKEGCSDLRKAIVLHDIAMTYRAQTKFVEARLSELESNAIYKKEIKHNQLGREYMSKKSIKNFSAGSLRPVCYLCHENWKVVPLLYGEDDGYGGDIPDESEPSFTHKPAGAVHGDQRWYCRDCKQSF